MGVTLSDMVRVIEASESSSVILNASSWALIYRGRAIWSRPVSIKQYELDGMVRVSTFCFPELKLLERPHHLASKRFNFEKFIVWYKGNVEPRTVRVEVNYEEAIEEDYNRVLST